MHSRSMSRRASRSTMANVNIGDDFTTPRIDLPDTVKKMDKFLERRGHIKLNQKSRLAALYRKCITGGLPAETCAKIRRDHEKEFAAFDKMKWN